MTLSEEQLVALAKDQEVDDWIKIARKDHKKLKLHYYGEGVTEYLSKIQNLENDAQIELRKKYAISNSWLVENLLRNVDNAWSAKGGLLSIETNSEEVEETIKENVKNVREGYSHYNYQKEIWFDRFVSDPNGLVFFEVTEDGETTIPTYKAITSIQKMKVSGIRPEYVKFEPTEIDIKVDEEIYKSSDRSKPKLLRTWIVDDSYYYYVELDDKENVRIIERIENSWGRVPGYQNSPILDTNREIKISPIWKQIELMDKYLNNGSIHEIYTFLHGYPIYWRYQQPCPSCKGSKLDPDTNYTDENGQRGKCRTCGGTGLSMKKDASDVILLAAPKTKDSPTIAPDVAGYISPDIDAWDQQVDELDRTWDLIYFSQWGTTTYKGQNETATGRFIDTQPVINRLHQYSDIFEVEHNEFLELLTDFYYPNTEVEVSVTYGRRYMVETSDQIFEKYTKAKNDNTDTTTLDLLLEQYYESEFKKNEVLREYYLKLIRVEPLVHYSILEVVSMNLPQQIKNEKIAYPDWKNSLTIKEVNEQEIEQLQESLTIFTNDKFVSNGETTSPEGGSAGGVSDEQAQES